MNSIHKNNRTLAGNAAVNWVGTLSQMLAVFLVTPILVKGLGDERYGIWAFIDSILAYLTVFDLGIGATVVRYVAKFEGSEDHSGINRTFTASLFLFSLAGVGVLFVAALVLGPLWPIVPIPGQHRHDAWWLFALLALNLAVGLPLGVYAAVLDGLQRYIPKTSVRMVTLVIYSLALIWVVTLGGGLFAIALCVTIVAIFENLVMCLLAHWYLPSLRIVPSSVDRSTLRMIGSYSSHAFLAMVAGRISFQTDAIVIGLFLPLSQITFFALPARLVEHVKGGLRSLTIVLTPHISKLEGQNNFAEIQRIYLTWTRYVLWGILPIQIGLWWFGHDFFRLWIGKGHADACYPVLATLSLPLTLALSQTIAGRILYGIGEVQIISRIAMLEAGVNLLLSLLLVPHLGILGVALGTIIPNIIGTLFVIHATCLRLEISLPTYIWRAFSPPIVTNVLIAICIHLSSSWIMIESWFTFFCVTGVIYLTMLLPAFVYEWKINRKRIAYDIR